MAIDRTHLSNAAISISFAWFVKMSRSDCWDLTSCEAAALLNIPESRYKEIIREEMFCKSDETASLPNETVERLSLLLGIWKRLQLWAPVERQDIAILAFKKPGSFAVLKGKSIKDYLIQGGCIECFYEVKDILSS